jgi:Uma2 family endonuclease
MVIAAQRYTFADLLAMPDGGNELYEIYGGELVVFSAPNPPHAAAVTELFGFLYAAQEAGHGQVATAPLAVAFDFAERGLEALDVTMPDLLFVREARRTILGGRCVEAAPDLVVEVLSPSTRERDLPGGRKWAIYERYGVPFYWIVDLHARTVAQYAWDAGTQRYGEPVVLGPGDVLACPLFPGLTRRVDRIFAGSLG